MIIYDMLTVDGKFYGTSKIICDSCHKGPIIHKSNVSRAELEKVTQAALDKSFREIYDWPHVEHVCRDGCEGKPETMLPIQSVWVAGDESIELRNVIKNGPGGIEGPCADIEFRIETPTPTDQPDIEYDSTLKLKKVLLIDGQNILKRCHFARSREVNHDGNHVGGVRGWVEMVSRVARRYRDRKVIAVWDGGSSPKRLAMLPTYRLRKPDESDYSINKQREAAVFIARQLGIVSLQYTNVEADDVIAYLSRHSDSSVTYSNDGDFIQLVREGHTVHRPIPREKGFDCIVSTVTFQKETGYNGSVAFALAKAMSGDTSDGIKGVPRIGEKTSLEILTATGISG
jgi:DNA polymerase-1